MAIVDWDVHHGNGTQDMFYDDPRVLYVSTHQSPLYPGTGQLRETGAGDGAGTHAQPAVPGGHRRRHVSAPRSTTVVVPVVERFAPDWLIISAGFDAHRNDPLAGLRADERRLRRHGASGCKALVPARRVLVVLEGGYDLEALTFGVGRHVERAASASRTGPSRPRPARSGCRPSPPPGSSGSCERATVR